MAYFQKKSGFWPAALLAPALLMIFLAGCQRGAVTAPAPAQADQTTSKGDEYYDDRITNDPDRDDVIGRAKLTDRGDPCAGDKECEDLCGDIYRRRKSAKKCEELSASTVERLKELHEDLEDADFDNLLDLDIDDFDLFVNISIESLSRLVGRYKKREAKEMLSWIVDEPEVTRIFKKEDSDFGILKSLLGELAGSDEAALKAKIHSGDTLLDLISKNRNEAAGDWIHEFIDEEVCGENSDIESQRCFEKYCAIGEAMDNDEAVNLLDFEYFEEYIQDIIEGRVNRGSWSDSNYEDVDELTEWYRELC